MSLLMKAGLSLNVFWQGTSKPLLHVDLSSFTFQTHWTILAIVWLNLSPGNSVSCYKLFTPSNWYSEALFLVLR